MVHLVSELALLVHVLVLAANEKPLLAQCAAQAVPRPAGIGLLDLL